LFCEEAGVRVGGEHHRAGSVGDTILWVCGNIVEELVDHFGRVFCSFGLLGADGAEGGQEFVVSCSGVIKERADDALDAFDTCVIKGWACVCVRDKLLLRAVNYFSMGVR
jgi:hypothetical protein